MPLGRASGGRSPSGGVFRVHGALEFRWFLVFLSRSGAERVLQDAVWEWIVKQFAFVQWSCKPAVVGIVLM